MGILTEISQATIGHATLLGCANHGSAQHDIRARPMKAVVPEISTEAGL